MVNISTIWCNKGGFFNRNGFILKDRRDLFYGGCVILRLAIILIVYASMAYKEIPDYRITIEDMKRARIVIPSLILIFSALSVVHGLSCLRADDNVWWSRKFGLVVAILLICLSGYVLYEIVEHDPDGDNDAKRRSDYALMLSLPIAIHLFLGILLSFTVYPSYFS